MVLDFRDFAAMIILLWRLTSASSNLPEDGFLQAATSLRFKSKVLAVADLLADLHRCGAKVC